MVEKSSDATSSAVAPWLPLEAMAAEDKGRKVRGATINSSDRLLCCETKVCYTWDGWAEQGVQPGA